MCRNKCCTLILPKVWARLHDDPLATGQRWYCHCEARYSTAFGMVLELIINGQSHFARAAVPTFSIQDAKAMSVERNEKAYATAEELYNAIPVVKPMDQGKFLRPMPNKEGFYKLRGEDFNTVPMLDWLQLYNIDEVKAYSKNKAKDGRGAAKTRPSDRP